jgi:hypothetical protein
VCHRDNVEKVQTIIALLFLVLQAQYPKLNVEGPFYPKAVRALKSNYNLGNDSVYTNSVTGMRLDPKTHPIYRVRSKAHMSLRIKGCTMFDRQAQDPSDVTVASSRHQRSIPKKVTRIPVRRRMMKKSRIWMLIALLPRNPVTRLPFMSFGTGKQSSAGSADAEAAMGQMTIENIPTEIQHGQQQNGDDMDDASVLSDTAADFEHNNADSAENPSE